MLTSMTPRMCVHVSVVHVSFMQIADLAMGGTLIIEWDM